MNFKTYLESKGHSKHSISIYYRNLVSFINWSEDENIETELATYNELLSYVKFMQARELKQKTIQLHIISLSHYFKWVQFLEHREDNPTLNINIKGVKRKALYHILKKAELEALYYGFEAELSKEEDSKGMFQSCKLVASRNKVILSLIIYQGLTTSELGRLSVSDVKLREGKIYISGCRRSNERTMKLESHQILDIMEYVLTDRKAILKLNNKESEALFTSTGNSTRMSNIMQKLMQKLKKQNPKIKNLQQIRTSVITNWLKHHNLREVQYMAGHRYVSSTESFLINDLDSLQEDISKFHPI